MGDEFDIEVASPALDGSIQWTPMSSEDPEAQQFLRIPGRTRPITPERAQTISAQQAEQRAVEREENRNFLGTAGQVAARTADEALFGILSAADPEYAEQSRAFEEAEPGLAMGAQGLGWLLPALVPAGPMLATGGGLAARAGLTAEQFVARSLARQGVSRGMARGAGLVGGAVADGAISGALDAVTRSNIQGTPLEAEQILANGLFGAGIGLGTAGIIAAPGMIRGARVGRAAAGEAAEVAEDAAGAMVPRVGQTEPTTLERAAALTSGSTPERVAQAHQFVRQHGPRALEAEAHREVVGNAATVASDMLNEVDSTWRRVSAANRADLAVNAGIDLADDAAGALTRTATDFIDSAVPPDVPRQVRRVRSRPGGGLIEELSEAQPGVGGVQNQELRSALQRIRTTLESGSGSAEAMVRAHDTALIDIAENNVLQQALQGSGHAEVRGLYDALLANLRNSGEGGRRLARFHEANRARLDAVGPNGLFSRYVDSSTGQLRVDPDRLYTALPGGMGESVTRDTANEFATLFEQTSERAGAAAALLGEPADVAEEQIARAAERFREAAEYSAGRESFLRLQLDEKQNSGLFASFGASGMGLGAVTGAALGSLAGGIGAPVGALLGAGFSLMTHPSSALRLLSRLGGGVERTQQRLARASGRLAGTLRRGGEFSSAAQRALPRTVVRLRNAEERRRTYNEYRDRIRELAGNPNALEDILAQGPGVISQTVSPVIGDAMSASLANGVYYLAQNLPAVDQPSILSQFEDYEPSDVEMDSFINRFEALEDPLSIIELAAEGALEVEHVEAVRTVYPRLYQEVQAEIAEVVGSLSSLPSYQQRMELGTLLGVPVDSTLTARFVQRMQQTFAQTPQQEQTVRSPSARTSVSRQMATDTYSATQSVSLSLG